MAYTGNWLRAAQQVQANPTRLPEPSPAHGQDQSDPYPQDHRAPAGADYGDADFARTIVQTPGLALDAPQDSHQSAGSYGTYRSQAERAAAQQRGHDGTDRGWVRQTYAAPPFQDDTTRYMESTWTGSGSAAPPVEAIQRGINSLPQNNPPVEGYDGPGWRRGRQRWRFVDRKNNINPRVYTPQQLLAREIKIPQNQPAQDGTWGRTSPFASMARPMNTIALRPALFRNPPGLTDTIIADQPPPADDGGLATDGMWTVT